MPHKLASILRPTPRDIDIAQGVTPVPIASIAEHSLGLSVDDYDSYGKYMAKARHRSGPASVAWARLRRWHLIQVRWCAEADAVVCASAAEVERA